MGQRGSPVSKRAAQRAREQMQRYRSHLRLCRLSRRDWHVARLCGHVRARRTRQSHASHQLSRLASVCHIQLHGHAQLHGAHPATRESPADRDRLEHARHSCGRDRRGISRRGRGGLGVERRRARRSNFEHQNRRQPHQRHGDGLFVGERVSLRSRVQMRLGQL